MNFLVLQNIEQVVDAFEQFSFIEIDRAAVMIHM